MGSPKVSLPTLMTLMYFIFYLFSRRFFQQTLLLCMVGIPEQFLIKRGLWWRSYGICSWMALEKNVIPMCPTHILIPRSFHCIQAHLWAWGRGDVSTPTFGSHLNSVSIGGRGADYSHSILVFWKPQARLVYISSGVKIDLLIHFLSSMSIKRAEAFFQIKPLLMAWRIYNFIFTIV